MMLAGAVIVGNAAGLTVIVLLTDARGLPQASVAVHVSVTGPPQAPGVAEKVDVFEVPVIRHDPLSPLVKLRVDEDGNAPHATMMLAGAVIVGNAAGLTVIALFPLIVLLHASVNVHVSVSVPPHPVTDPVLTAVTVPEIRQVPDAELE